MSEELSSVEDIPKVIENEEKYLSFIRQKTNELDGKKLIGKKVILLDRTDYPEGKISRIAWSEHKGQPVAYVINITANYKPTRNYVLLKELTLVTPRLRRMIKELRTVYKKRDRLWTVSVKLEEKLKSFSLC